MSKEKLLALIDKYLAGDTTAEEIDFLKRYYNSFQENTTWNEAELGLRSEMKSKMFKRIQEETGIADSENALHVPNNQKGKIRFLKPGLKLSSFTRIAAAACVFGLLVTGAYFFFSNKEIMPVQTAKKSINKQLNNDVLPGGNKATLTLADGSTINLDDAQNGALAQQGNTRIIKIDGKLAYNTANKNSDEIVYNTVSTPRGGQYQIELPDGTQVWLNAASSLRFPTSFAGKERRVEIISGEAYFEVTKNKKMPFVVGLNNAEIQVLGTHFNVMAYAEEAAIKTTLVEGSIKFVRQQKALLLKPGEQTQLFKDGRVKLAGDVDLEQVVAWKNGLFQFENSDIESAMRQLSRWYDVSVVYQNKNHKPEFVGEMSRSSTLSEVLKALELTSKIHFQIEGKKIIVM
ncbi:MAG: FecR family protein [Ferruginibacter sp.]